MSFVKLSIFGTSFEVRSFSCLKSVRRGLIRRCVCGIGWKGHDSICRPSTGWNGYVFSLTLSRLPLRFCLGEPEGWTLTFLTCRCLRSCMVCFALRCYSYVDSLALTERSATSILFLYGPHFNFFSLHHPFYSRIPADTPQFCEGPAHRRLRRGQEDHEALLDPCPRQAHLSRTQTSQAYPTREHHLPFRCLYLTARGHLFRHRAARYGFASAVDEQTAGEAVHSVFLVSNPGTSMSLIYSGFLFL